MKTVSLSGSLRENVGKKDAKSIRQQGNVPCVIYGGKEQIHFFTDERNFQKIVFTPEACFVEIELNGSKHLAVLQDIQYHPVTDKILHADFLEIYPEKVIKMSIPVKLEGTAPGVLKGGKLVLKMRKLPLKGQAKNIPQEIVIDISKMNINDKIKAGNLKSEHYDILLNDNTVIVMILKSRGADTSSSDEDEKTEE